MKKIADVWIYMHENTRDAGIFSNEIYTCRNILRLIKWIIKLLCRFW